MTSAGSRAFSCRTPPRAQYYPPYPSATTTAAAMTPSPTRYYSPPAASYYRPATAMMYPPQYGGSPNKQRKGRGKYDDGGQVMLPDSTTLTPPNSLSMKKSSVQVRVVPACLLVNVGMFDISKLPECVMYSQTNTQAQPGAWVQACDNILEALCLC